MTGPETIFALSSGSAMAAVSVIRLSGPSAHLAVADLISGALPRARQMVLRTLRDAAGDVLDQSLIVLFDKGASFTGEPMAEIHCHGGVAVVGSILEALGVRGDCRPAEPGEFTKRALLAGRISITEAEGLSDLVRAETRLQQRQAMSAMLGGVQRKIEEWRAALVRARALVEVSIDWADEEVPEDVGPEVRDLLSELVKVFRAEIERGFQAEKLRNGIEVAIIGPPNVGKSSLLNAIAGREAAIVSSTAGTTRDVIEVRYDLNGLLIVFLDTAGLRETEDKVEAIGVNRAEERAAMAELRLHLSSADTDMGEGNGSVRLWQDGDISVWSKADLGQGERDVSVCSEDRVSVDHLLDLIWERLSGRSYGEGLLGHERQRQALEAAVSSLSLCLDRFDAMGAEEIAEELRSSISALDRLSGRLGVEDVLDVVFGTFCLGK